MHRLYRLIAVLLVALPFTAGAAQAQETPAAPKILQVTREYVKPGKGGAPHDKTESAFVQAVTKAKWPTHYIGLNSLSGKSRAIFLTRYDSFDAWEKDNAAVAKNSALAATLDHASVVDGDLLDGLAQAVLVERDDLSYHSVDDIGHLRFLEATTYHVRPGHNKDWDEIVKIVKAAYDKADVGAHWGLFELEYGGSGGTYLVLIGHPALVELDKGFWDDKKFVAALGEDGLKKLDKLFGEAVASSDSELFAVDPHMSYPTDDWVKADPAFWNPKPAPVAKAKPAAAKPTP